MSESSEKTEEKKENATDTAEEAQEPSAKADEKPAEPQEAPAEAEDKPKATKKESAKAAKKPVTVKEKPLEKMTVKELREKAKDLPGITGVHAMKKDELLDNIKQAKGIADEPVKKADADIARLKQRIKALKVERQAALEARDKKKATIFRRRISRLKKKTRRAAA